MLKQITKRYKELITTALKLLSLLLLCTAIGTVIVLPLWDFAVKAPVIYSITILILIAVCLLFLFIKWVKATGIKASVFKIIRLLVIATAIVICIKFVLDGTRLLCIPVLAAAIVLYGIFWNSARSSEK